MPKIGAKKGFFQVRSPGKEDYFDAKAATLAVTLTPTHPRAVRG